MNVTVLNSAVASYTSTGVALPPGFESLPEAYGYTSGNLTTITRTSGSTSWVKTLTYSSGVLTAVSAWVQA